MGSAAGTPARAGDSDAGDHGGRARLHELMDEGGRTVVEKVRVVDEDEQGPLAGVVEELMHVAAELIGVRLGTDQVRVAVEERGEGAERIGPGRLGTRNEGHRHFQVAARTRRQASPEPSCPRPPAP